MVKARILTVAIFFLAGLMSAQTPNWDDTVLTELTETEVNKSINHGSIFVDEDDRIHVVYLENRREDNDEERLLFYTMRDTTNVWSGPEIITDAGLFLKRPNIIKNPATGELEVFGIIEGELHRITKEDDQWQGREIELDFPLYDINVAVDQDGYVHLAGFIHSEDRRDQIVYLTDYRDEISYSLIRDSHPYQVLEQVRPVIELNDDGIAVIGYIGRRDTVPQAHIIQNNEQGGHEWSHEITAIPDQTAQTFNLLVKNDTIHLVSAGQIHWPGQYRLFYQYRNLEEDRWSQPVVTNEGDSSIMPSMAFDNRNRLHIVSKEIMTNIFTGNIKYITNANPAEEWEVSNPFNEDYNWEWPQLAIDSQDNFQMIVLRQTEEEKELVHIGVLLEVPLSTPQNLSAESDQDSVTLKWEEPDLSVPGLPEFLGYDIHRKYDDEQEFEIINTETVEDTYYLDKGLQPGKYSYYITAIFDDERSNPSDTVRVIIKEQLPTPKFKPEEGKYAEPVKVTILCPIDKGIIFYTDDESEPDTTSIRYETPFLIEEDTVIKAKSFHQDYLPSKIAKISYQIKDVSAKDETVKLETALLPAYPNPFNPYTNIRYQLAGETFVRLEVFNIIGDKLDILVDEVQPAGKYTVTWSGIDSNNRQLPSGLYLFRLTADDTKKVIRALMIK